MFIRPLNLLILLMAAVALLPMKAAASTDPIDFGRLPLRIFNDRDGLPQIVVNTIAFDKRGYLWVGTQDGAAYYNGRRWTVVHMPHRNVSNWITEILMASDGSIWFATYIGGVARLKDDQW